MTERTRDSKSSHRCSPWCTEKNANESLNQLFFSISIIRRGVSCKVRTEMEQVQKRNEAELKR